MENIKNAKAVVITYIAKVSLGSLSGSDKEAENISSIKKINVGVDQYPYKSSQAVRRAIRDQLGTMGEKLSEGVASTIAKGASTTLCDPANYIDDDLFGYMSAEAGQTANKRTSPVRVSALVALNEYQGDLDFGTNYMSVKAGGDPNIFETEIHAGLYRGSILIELDRVGCDEGFEKDLPNEEKRRRVILLLDAIKNLWGAGRQSRFLSDISPKFLVSAIMKTKNPIFLESVILNGNEINNNVLQETLDDYQDQILDHTIGMRSDMFKCNMDYVTIKNAFDKMKRWVEEYFVN